MTRIAIVGASGYAGGEAARLIAAHPLWELGVLTASRNEGRLVSEVHPHLRSAKGRRFEAIDTPVLIEHDVVILALPHGHSGALGEELIAAKPSLVVVDLGADRRLVNPDDWERFYGGAHHAPWVYALPELVLAEGSKQREKILGATRLVAPGCNATAIILALAPLLQGGVVSSRDIVATLAVGPSGAGRTLREDLLAAERLSSAMAYQAGGRHRHIPEILQTLSMAASTATPMTLSMTPVLVPMARGILAVSTASLAPGAGEDEARAAFRAAYSTEPFVEVMEAGQLPESGSVLGSNAVSMGCVIDESAGRVTVVSAIDNLVKGTAGQAIQSLNLALGLPEATGLPVDGLAP